MDPENEDYDPKNKTNPDVKKINLLEIAEKKIFVRKAKLKDFKQSIINCKPTVS